MRRPRTTLFSIVLALGLVAAACSSSGGDTVAADVDGYEISRADVLEEMADRGDVYIEDPAGFEIYAPFERFATEEVDTITGEEMPLMQEVLGRQIIFQLLNAEVEQRGETPTEEDATAARDQVEAAYGQLLDTPFHNREVARFEDVMVLARVLGEEVDEITVDELYEQILASGDTACSSHILVETSEEADQVIADIEAGGSFEEIAIERSLDPGSGANGGSLGCGPATQFVPEFAAAVIAQPVGEIGQPVQTDFGFHVIRVDARPMPLNDETRAQLEQQVVAANEQASTSALDTWIRGVLDTAQVEVDTKIGYWDDVAAAVVPDDPEVDVTTTLATE
ncbi:MAG: peptidylprolyl isomerase [Acidimicrobiales bacterium]